MVRSTAWSGSIGIVRPRDGSLVEGCQTAFSPWVIVEADRRQYGGKSIIVHLRIMPDGTLKEPQVTKSSGSTPLDRAAVMAIYKAGRVKPPPAKLRPSFEKVGFNMKFIVPTS